MELKLTERIDYDEIEQFYDYWELEHIIDFDSFKGIIANKIIEMAQVESSETESDVIIINGNDSRQYDIDIEFDHEKGSAWIYPTAYGKQLSDDGVCVLPENEKLELDDKCFKNDIVVNFCNDILYELKISPEDIKCKLRDFANTLVEFPADEWNEICIDDYQNYDIDSHFLIEQDNDTGDITERITVYPIAYGKTLVSFPYVIYERTVKND